MRYRTKQKYLTLKDQLKPFLSEYDYSDDISCISEEYIEDFKTYLMSSGQVTDTTVQKTTKCLIAVIHFLMRKKKIPYFSTADIKLRAKDGEVYSITIDEICKLQHYQFIGLDMRVARDIFCFLCWTGQRYGDYVQLTKSNQLIKRDGNWYWELITSKTSARVSIILPKRAVEICNKYRTPDGHFCMPYMYNQKINNLIKEACRIVGLNRHVIKVKYFRGVADQQMLPLWKVVTVHVARKSYITNLLLQKIPEREVRMLSAHKTDKNFQKYIDYRDRFLQQSVLQAFD